jgi:hypothetical protein
LTIKKRKRKIKQQNLKELDLRRTETKVFFILIHVGFLQQNTKKKHAFLLFSSFIRRSTFSSNGSTIKEMLIQLQLTIPY